MSNGIAQRLDELESIIRNGLKAFVEIGRALLEIRNDRLYREQGFTTFEDYCWERWKMSRIHAHRMIEAAGVAENLLPMGNIPQTERQARELARLAPEQQREVASGIDFMNATAADVQAAVKQHASRPATAKTAKRRNNDAPPAAETRNARIALALAAMPQPVLPQQACANFNWHRSSLSKRIYDVQSIPWIQVDKVQVDKQRIAYRVTVNQDYKRICDGERPSKSGETPNNFCRRLLAELTRRREEIKEKNAKGRWLPVNVSKIELTLMLDWIQGELETFICGQSVDRREDAAKMPRLIGQGEANGSQNKIRVGSSD